MSKLFGVSVSEDEVVGAVLVGPTGTAMIALCNRGIQDPRNRRVFRAIRDVMDDRKAVDMVTVSDQLMEDGALEEAGGMEHLSGLVDAWLDREKEAA